MTPRIALVPSRAVEDHRLNEHHLRMLMVIGVHEWIPGEELWGYFSDQGWSYRDTGCTLADLLDYGYLEQDGECNPYCLSYICVRAIFDDELESGDTEPTADILHFPSKTPTGEPSGPKGEA